MTAYPSLVLALDTCGHACSLALVANDGTAVFNQTQWMARGHGAALPALAATALAQVNPSRINAVIVTRGPGGFTGMRAGLAYARAFALGRSIPAFGITVDASLRLTVGMDTAIAIDSRRGDYFLGSEILPLDTLAAIGGSIAGSWDLSTSKPRVGWHEPCPLAMGRHGHALLAAGERADPGALEPLYIRAPSVG